MSSSSRAALVAFFLGFLVALAAACGPSKACSVATCSSGCCDAAGICQLASSPQACGSNGFACVQVCALQACTGGSGGGTGGGSAGGAGGGAAPCRTVTQTPASAQGGDDLNANFELTRANLTYSSTTPTDQLGVEVVWSTGAATPAPCGARSPTSVSSRGT